MSSTLLKNNVEDYQSLWRDYWKSKWHFTPNWDPIERFHTFLSAPEARKLDIVYDYPSGKRPFLGALTKARNNTSSEQAGVLEFPQSGHLLTIAPTRSGKGVSHIIPNLLFYSGSAVVIDIKGENYDITANRRASMFDGSKVIKFAPFDDAGNCYNPLDFIRVDAVNQPSSYSFDDARLLAEMLLPSKIKDDYWDIEARNLLTAIILFVACRFGGNTSERTMRTVVDILFSEPNLDEATSGIEQFSMELFEYALETKYQPLKALASSLIEHEAKIRNNIVSTCRSGMQVWLSERLLKATDTSDLQFIELKTSMCRPLDDNPAPTTIYIIIPPEYLSEYRGVLRMMTGLAAVELTRSVPWKENPKWRTDIPCPVTFFLDEFPALGFMKPIADGMAYLAGYGVQLWIFAQNIGQLKSIYEASWENFPANSGATSFFGVNDPDTAEYIERLLGETPEYLHQYSALGYSNVGSTSSSQNSNSYSGISSSSSSSSTNIEAQEMRLNHRHTKAKIAPASEIRAMSDELQLIFIRNTPPILATKVPHYKFELLNGLYETWEK